MSARDFEAFLARIYVDPFKRAAFKANPRSEALRAGLSEEECSAVEKIDWVGLEMVAGSFAKKRQSKLERRHPKTFFRRVRQFVLNLRRLLHFNQ